MKDKKIAIVFGTRPEVIKLSSIIKECQKKGIAFLTIHTGQHYSCNMDSVFFEQLQLPEPDFQLEIKSTAPFMQGEHTGRMMAGIEKIILDEKPTDVLVQGDTNTVLAGALVSAKISTVSQLAGFCPKLGHVEACLRSYDKSMPEEMNRIVADHISDFLFAPTQNAKNLGLKENLCAEKIIVTGNTVVDSLKEHLKKVDSNQAMKKLGLGEKSFALLTLHRQENVDIKERLLGIFEGLKEFNRKEKIPIIFPVHPRTKKMLGQFRIKLPAGIKCIDAIGYFEFLNLEKNSSLIFTDSGGVQEEACIFGVPCVTLRKNTERPETIEIGANCLAGNDPAKIAFLGAKMLHSRCKWKQPFGEGNTGKKIIGVLMKN